MNKQVILYSGGMDSVALAHMYPEAELVYFAMATKYTRDEMKRLPGRTHIMEIPLLGSFERPDAIIPMRNLILVTLASLVGDEILIGATAGDRVLDKSEKFLEDSSSLLSYLWSPQHWTEGRNITVSAPFKRLTKTQIIAECKERGVAESVLRTSFSCYTPRNGKECGHCKPCFRKWVAAEANGIRLETAFAAAIYGQTIADEIRSRGEDELADTKKAYANIGVDFE